MIYFHHIAHLRQQCHNSKCVIFQGKRLKLMCVVRASLHMRREEKPARCH